MKNTLLALACGAALMASQAHASNVNVGGVIWDPASTDDFFTTDTIYETVVTNFGDELKGYGKISYINGLDTFCPGCELTYQFGGYNLDAGIENDLNGSFNAGDRLSFIGGWIKMYVDKTPDFALDNFDSAGDDGGTNALWLDLAARSQTAIFGSSSLTGTLFSLLQTGSLGTGTEGGNGFGNLDVIGGLAKGNLDTNGEANGSDLSLTSSFQPRRCALSGTCTSEYVLFGTNDIAGNSIPEPASLLLVSLGLLSAGALRRRKAK